MTDALLIILDNDRAALGYCLATAYTAESQRNELAANSDVLTPDECVRDWLAGEIRDYVESATEGCGDQMAEPGASIVSTIVAHALGDVNWQHVARHYLAKHADSVTA